MKNIKGIYSTRCWLNGKLRIATILFKDGKINQIIEDEFLDETGIINAGNDIIMPGIIDPHVHINEPGRTSWEGFDTATQAAAAGGITTIVDMPLNSSPVTISLPAFQEKLNASIGKLNVNVGFYGGLVPGNEMEIEALIKAGILGLKAFLVHSGIDEFPAAGEKELKAAMLILAKAKLPILAHCEIQLAEDESDKEKINPQSYQDYLRSRPKSWENEAVKLMINLSETFNCKTHIVHLSSAEALPYIQKARKKGIPLTVETCPHYLFFEAENIPDADTLFKCAPPIRGKTNNQLLKRALKNGDLDFLATDHSPSPPELKEIESGNLQKAWGGIAGLQFLLPSSWTSLKKELSLEEFIPLLTENPAKFLGIEDRKGKLGIGCDADLVVWSPESTFTAKKENLYHNHKISPYLECDFYGKVMQTYVDGKLVFDKNQIVQKNVGQWILKK